MTNFLNETINALNRHNLVLEDAKYIGSDDIQLTVEQFKQIANVKYNNCYYFINMPNDIMIHFDDYIFYRHAPDWKDKDTRQWECICTKYSKDTKFAEISESHNLNTNISSNKEKGIDNYKLINRL